MLGKIAIDRATKEMMKGNLSQKALERLKREKVFREPERYIEGLNKGTENILKRYDYSLNKSKSILEAMRGGGYYTASGEVHYVDLDNPLHRAVSPVIPKTGPKSMMRLADALAKRHEAYEVIEAHRNAAEILSKRQPELGKTRREFLDFKPKPTDNPFVKAKKLQRRSMLRLQVAHPETVKATLININDQGIDIHKLKTLKNGLSLRGIEGPDKKFRFFAGRHYSLGVLGREANDMARFPYKELLYLDKVRSKTGERELLKKITGKDLYTQGTDPKSYRKLVKAKPLTSSNPLAPNYYIINGPKRSHPIFNTYLKGLDKMVGKIMQWKFRK